MASEPLKLLAQDADDVAVLSAMLQDALVPVGEMVWERDRERFVLVANRFRWEGPAERDRRGEIRERVHSGLCISHVKAVRRRGLDPRQRAGILSLLAIRHEAVDGGGAALDLTFSGGAAIRVEVSEVLARLDDIDEPWPTRARPRHDPI